ncbi:MAG TPA: cell division protein FtsQ/DivIB [Methylocella sp.]|nr:cell division protein FtsQ/DivIB [Methylocella sp.]
MTIAETAAARPEILPPARPKRQGLRHQILSRLAGPGTGACFSLSLLLVVGGYGAVKGGHYAAFVAANGQPADILAKAFGFSIKSVTISGEREIKEPDLLTIAGIGPRNSLLFLDVAKIRERLLKLPLVKEAAITKLYPDRLLIEIEERQPFALWQCDGHVQIVAADGVPIAAMRDQRFIHLPLVVGTGANEKLGQYLALLDTAGDMRERIVAGVLVAQRRWTLKTANGIEILLPETAPEDALARLAELQRTAHILDRDLISLDLRQPGRLVARLTEEAAAERAATLLPKSKAKGGHI